MKLRAGARQVLAQPAPPMGVGGHAEARIGQHAAPGAAVTSQGGQGQDQPTVSAEHAAEGQHQGCRAVGLVPRQGLDVQGVAHAPPAAAVAVPAWGNVPPHAGLVSPEGFGRGIAAVGQRLRYPAP